MNIILREMRANLKGLVIWCLGIIILVSGASTELETLQNESFDIAEVMKMFPEAMYEALSFDLISFNTPEGYFSYIGEYLTMLAAIYAVLAGVNILSKELRKKTSETLFSMPITRSYIIRMKFIAALIYSLIFTGVLYIGTLLSFMRFEPTPEFFTHLPLYFFFVFIVQIIFLTGGLCLSVLSHNHKRVGPVAVGITLMLYVLTFLIGIHEAFGFLKYITPFEYFSAISIMRGTPIEGYSYLITTLLILVFAGVSLTQINRKDIL